MISDSNVALRNCQDSEVFNKDKDNFENANPFWIPTRKIHL